MAVPQLTSSSSTRRLSLRTTRPDPFLSLCKCFSFVVVLSAILCIAVNVLSAIRSFKHQSDIFDGIFRCYAVFLACFVVLAETEWNFIIKFWKGILCVGLLKRSRQKQEISREQAEKDLQELERRREELEQLLITE
ncbi:hypothetical protein JHK85_038053 [Glycine max]|nr:hypothetical protein JHK85_038053 [Glycine max]